eukprot:m.118189 g.118189  ORF g.118189 m.118189 type:complete len:592 (-) comp17199_c0_seq1:157-1932(-)
MAFFRVVFALALPFLVASTTREPPRKATDKPNFIMLFVDDLGYGDTGFNGHPTTVTPNIDKIAWGGKILTSWYSGCPVCSGSRAALMTGRQFNRIGVPGVFGPGVDVGLPLNETTVADQMKKAGYTTAIMGKWHLGQRAMFLPASRGFDYYLGIPYSDDMGEARATPCSGDDVHISVHGEKKRVQIADNTALYADMGYLHESEMKQFVQGGKSDPGTSLLPLVYQNAANKTTTVLEQPLDFTHLAEKYNDYVTGFIREHASVPFFLYMPFSHVHTTAGNQPEEQYAGCRFKNTTRRGPFGDALAEADWIVGNVITELETAGIDKNTLVLFTGDNGPWMVKGLSGGSEGLLVGRYAGYWNTGKGSTWEGGMHEAAFAYWPGTIMPMSRSSEVVSSMDVFPTLSTLAGVALPTDRVYDGRDMSHILLDTTGTAKSAHDALFMYGGCTTSSGPSAVRFGQYKAYWCTGPGLGGGKDLTVRYNTSSPLVFDIWQDPSEGIPLDNHTALYASVVAAIMPHYTREVTTFTHGSLVAPPNLPSERQPDGSYLYAICCDRAKECDCDGKPSLGDAVDPTRVASVKAELPWFMDASVFDL